MCYCAGSNIILEETMRNLADALRVLRSLIIDNSFVCGGGSAEISCSLALDAAADTYPGYARVIVDVGSFGNGTMLIF
jgi:chaperonin GroEL (HSP60 family)